MRILQEYRDPRSGVFGGGFPSFCKKAFSSTCCENIFIIRNHFSFFLLSLPCVNKVALILPLHSCLGYLVRFVHPIGWWTNGRIEHPFILDECWTNLGRMDECLHSVPCPVPSRNGRIEWWRCARPFCSTRRKPFSTNCRVASRLASALPFTPFAISLPDTPPA